MKYRARHIVPPSGKASTLRLLKRACERAKLGDIPGPEADFLIFPVLGEADVLGFFKPLPRRGLILRVLKPSQKTRASLAAR